MDRQIDVWTKWDEQTYGTNKHMGRTNIWDEQTYYGTNKHIMGRTNIGTKKSRDTKFFFVCALILTQMVLKHPQCHGGSKYVLRFEIGQWEGDFYSERTNTHRHFGKL